MVLNAPAAPPPPAPSCWAAEETTVVVGDDEGEEEEAGDPFDVAVEVVVGESEDEESGCEIALAVLKVASVLDIVVVVDDDTDAAAGFVDVDVVASVLVASPALASEVLDEGTLLEPEVTVPDIVAVEAPITRKHSSQLRRIWRTFGRGTKQIKGCERLGGATYCLPNQRSHLERRRRRE